MKNSFRIVINVLALSVGLIACSEKLDRSNPFDPKAPKAVQAKATLRGSVTLEDPAETGTGTNILLAGAEGNFTTITDSDGRFVLSGIISGDYTLSVSRKGFEEAKSSILGLGIAEDRDIGSQSLLMLRGTAMGRATLEGAGEHSGIAISMFRSSASTASGLSPLATTGGTVTSYASLTNTDGSYGLSGLPEGSYTLVAIKKDFTPAYLQNIIVKGKEVTQMDVVKLYPVTAVIKINDVARYTNVSAVNLNLFAFNAVEMQVSEDSSFTGMVFETFNASKAMALSAGDGEKTVWAQFKDKYGIISDKYSAKIVLDTTPPYSAGVTINGGATYTRSGLVTLSISSADALSGVVKMLLSEDSTFAGAVWEEFNTAKVFSMSAGDGAKVLYAKFQPGQCFHNR
jgi:hypothetical protein